MVNTDQLLCNVRRCKELPIEARHTICLEISKKRRQRIASRTSVFIPKELSYINYRKMFQRYEKSLSTSKKKFKSRLLNSRGFNKKLGALKNTTNRITKVFQNTKLKNQPKKPNDNRKNHQKNEQQQQKRRLKQHKLTHPESYIIPQKLSPILIGERIRSAVKNLRKDASSTKLFAISNTKQLVEQQIQLGTDQNVTISYTVEMPTDNSIPQTLEKSPGKTISILDELPCANNVIDNSKLAPTQKRYLEIISPDQFIRNELLEATKADDYACVPIPNNNSIIDNYNNNNSIIDNYNNCNNNNSSNNENNYSNSNNNINRDRSLSNNNNNSNNKTKSEPISSSCYEQHQQVSSAERSFPNSELGNYNYYVCKAPEINQANLTAAMEKLQLAQVLPKNLSSSVTSRANVVHYNAISSTIQSPATAYSNFVSQEKQLLRQNMFGFYQPDPTTPRSSDAVDDYPGSYSNIMDQRFVKHANYQQHIDSFRNDHILNGTCNMPSNRSRSSSNVTINSSAKKERPKRPKINYARQSHRLQEDNNCEADSTTPLNANTYPSWSRHLVNGESLGRLSKVMDLASTNDEQSIDIATMYKQQHQLHHQQNSIHHPALDYHQQQSILHPAVHQQQQPIHHPVAHHPTVHHPVAHHPTLHHPVAHRPTVHHPVAHHPTVHHPVAHHPAVHHLTSHHPTPHQPAVHHLTVHHPTVHYPILHHQLLQPILHSALYHHQHLQHPILLHQQQSDVLNQPSVLQPALHHQQQQQDKQIPFPYYQQQFEEQIHHNHNQQQYHQLSLLHQQLIHQSQHSYDYTADKFAATYPPQVRYLAPHFTSPLTTADPPSSGVSDPRHYYHQLSLDNGCCHQRSPSALHEIKRLEKLFF